MLAALVLSLAVAPYGEFVSALIPPGTAAVLGYLIQSVKQKILEEDLSVEWTSVHDVRMYMYIVPVMVCRMPQDAVVSLGSPSWPVWCWLRS